MPQIHMYAATTRLGCVIYNRLVFISYGSELMTTVNDTICLIVKCKIIELHWIPLQVLKPEINSHCECVTLANK